MSNLVSEPCVRLWYPGHAGRFGEWKSGRGVDRPVVSIASPTGDEILLDFEPFGIWDLKANTPPRLTLSVFLDGISLTIPMPRSALWVRPHIVNVDGWVVMMIFGRSTLDSVWLRPSV